MIKNMFVSVGRKISAHIVAISVFCVCLLLFGGFIQLLSTSTTFSNYFDKQWTQSSSSPSDSHGHTYGNDPIVKLHLTKTYRRIAKDHELQPSATNAIISPKRFDHNNNNDLEQRHGNNKFVNLKSASERKRINNSGMDGSKSNNHNNINSNISGSKATSTVVVVNSTKKTLLAAAIPNWPYANSENGDANNNKDVIDWINQYNSQNVNRDDDDTIYIDSDDDNDTNNNSPVYEIDGSQQSASLEQSQTINVHVPDDVDVFTLPSPETKSSHADDTTGHRGKQKHFRNKKSDKLTSRLLPSFNDYYRYPDGFSNFDDDGDSDGDDDVDRDINSGSGDYGSWTEYIEQEQRQRNILPPMPVPKMHNFNAFSDKSIPEKFARAHNRIRNGNRFKNDAPNKRPNGKSTDPDGNWLDSDSIIGGDVSNKGNNNNAWTDTRGRRILGNIKKSEERSRQILLCKGEGELCSMLFKAPVKTALVADGAVAVANTEK